MDLYSMASKLFGTSRIEDTGAPESIVGSLTGIGATASADGAVGVVMDADITPADDAGDIDETIIEMPTSPAVAENDDVIIGLTGEGPLKVPVVLANPGIGDRQQAQITEAYDLASSVEGIAQQALDVANATGQHFWSDADGAHVTEVTQEEWTDPTDPGHQSGPNSLWNALGMLFRDGLANLMALIAGRSAATITFDGAQSEQDFGRYVMPINTRSVTSVTADGAAVAYYGLMRYGAHVELEVSAPASTASIEVVYETDSAVSFFHNGKVTAEIAPAGMTLSRDYEQGTIGSASLDFFGGKAQVYAYADTEDATAETQSISLTSGVSSDASAMVDVESGDSGATVRLQANHQSQRYFFPVFELSSEGTDNVASLKSNTVRLDYGDNNPHGGPFDFTMQQVLQAIRCRTNSTQAWVNADTYTGENTRLFMVGATVDNSASAYDGRNAQLYVKTNGMNAYIVGSGSQAAATPWSLLLPSGTTNLNVQTGTVTRGSSASTLGSVSFHKHGNVVTLIVSGMKLAGNLNSGVTSGTVATVPAGWRPPMTYRTALINNSTGNFGNAWVVVGSGGVIQVANRSQTQLTTSHELSFTATYIV